MRYDSPKEVFQEQLLEEAKKNYWSNNIQGHVQRPQIMIWKSANSYLCWVMRILNTPLQTLYMILIKTTYQCMNTSGKISNCWDLTTLLMFWYHVFDIVVFTVEGNNCVFRGQVVHVGWGRSVTFEGFSFKNMSSGQSREETMHAYWKHPVKGVADFRNVMLRREEKGMSVAVASTMLRRNLSDSKI